MLERDFSLNKITKEAYIKNILLLINQLDTNKIEVYIAFIVLNFC